MQLMYNTHTTDAHPSYYQCTPLTLLMRTTHTLDAHHSHHLKVGIVSFGSSNAPCGMEGSSSNPAVYTRIDAYLEWIDAVQVDYN